MNKALLTIVLFVGVLRIYAQNGSSAFQFQLTSSAFRKISQSPKLWQLQVQPQLPVKQFKGFDGQTLTRMYRPTWSTSFFINELNVSNGERNIQGFGQTNYREKQNH